jgi:hypothetical protein
LGIGIEESQVKIFPVSCLQVQFKGNSPENIVVDMVRRRQEVLFRIEERLKACFKAGEQVFVLRYFCKPEAAEPCAGLGVVYLCGGIG